MRYLIILILAVGAFAQVPEAPDSVMIEYYLDGDSLEVSWAPVEFDTSGIPICVSRYNLYASVSFLYWTRIAITLDQYHSITWTPPDGYSDIWVFHVTATEGG